MVMTEGDLTFPVLRTSKEEDRPARNSTTERAHTTAGPESKSRAMMESPILLTTLATVPIAGVAAAVLALLFSHRTGGSDELYYLNGVKGSLFLLLGSLSVMICLPLYGVINSISLFAQASIVARRADELRSGRSTEKEGTAHREHERVYIDHKAIDALNGHPSSWRWAWKNIKRSDSGITRRSLVLTITISLVIMIFALLLLAADIWLHIAIKNDNITAPRSSVTGARAFGRALAPACAGSNGGTGSWQVPLNINLCVGRLDLVLNDTDAYSTLSGGSTLNDILEVSPGLNHENVQILADTAVRDTQAFSARTYGVSTQCRMLQKSCEMDVPKLRYNCSNNAFSGYVTQPLAFSTPTMFTERSEYLAATAILGDDGEYTSSLNGPSSAVSSDGTTIMVVVNCTAEVLEVSYSYQSGTVRARSVKSADQRVQWLVLAAMFPGQVAGYDAFGLEPIIQSTTAAASNAKRPQDVADAFAISFSRAAIASAVGIMTPMSASGATVTAQGSVTLLPKGAILMIVVVDFILALLGLTLGVAAFILDRRDGRIGQIRSLITSHGALAAALTGDTSGTIQAPPSRKRSEASSAHEASQNSCRQA